MLREELSTTPEVAVFPQAAPLIEEGYSPPALICTPVDGYRPLCCLSGLSAQAQPPQSLAEAVASPGGGSAPDCGDRLWQAAQSILAGSGATPCPDRVPESSVNQSRLVPLLRLALSPAGSATLGLRASTPTGTFLISHQSLE